MTNEESLLPTFEGDLATEIEKGKLSRRNFLMMAGFGGLGALGGLKAYGTLLNKTPILSDSKGVLVHDPNRCVGCTRCEKACTEFNDGYSSEALARVRVSRNLMWGPAQAGQNAFFTGQGTMGNGKVVAETCKQCPHPVPCAEACPVGAIQVEPTTGARMIIQSVCIGCGICTKACPWAMPVTTGEENIPAGSHPNTKAQKCFLCAGNTAGLPAGTTHCSHACPTGALKLMSWRDVRNNTPLVNSGILPAATTTNCATCHS